MRYAFLVSALAATTLCGQATVVPNAYATKQGGRSFALPFSYGAYLRHQQLIDAKEVPIGSLTGIAFRSRTATTLVNVRDRAWQDLRVQLSSSPKTLSTMSPTYAQNHGKDLATVFNGKMDLYKRNNNAPLEFNCVVPFSQPFVFVRVGPLCVDLYPQNNGYEFNTGCPQGGNGTAMDFAQDALMRYVQPAKSRTCTNNPPASMAGTGTATGGYVLKVFMNGDLMPIGRACPGTGGAFPIIGNSGGGAKVGNQAFTIELSGANRNGKNAFFTLGIDNRMDRSTRLPVNLSKLGMTQATDCWLNNNILVGVVVPLAAGRAFVKAPIPQNNALRNVEVFTQFAVDDPGISGFTTSQSGLIHIQ